MPRQSPVMHNEGAQSLLDPSAVLPRAQLVGPAEPSRETGFPRVWPGAGRSS